MAAWAVGVYLGELTHEAAGGLGRVGAAGPADPEELHDINAALAQFQPADETVLAVQFAGQFPLREAGILAKTDKRLAHMASLLGLDRLDHARMLRAEYGCFQNAGTRMLVMSREAWDYVACADVVAAPGAKRAK